MDAKDIPRFFELFADATQHERFDEVPAISMAALQIRIKDCDSMAFQPRTVVELSRAFTGESSLPADMIIRQQAEQFLFKRS